MTFFSTITSLFTGISKEFFKKTLLATGRKSVTIPLDGEAVTL
jgi:hypothetical protein